jgi:hypothetical protein
VALNTARDVGGRLAAMTLFGMKASGGTYAAIAALTNIPAMIFAVLLYEFFLTDPDRGSTVFFAIPLIILTRSRPVVPSANLEYISVHKNHRRYEGDSGGLNQSNGDEKGSADMFDNARP